MIKLNGLINIGAAYICSPMVRLCFVVLVLSNFKVLAGTTQNCTDYHGVTDKERVLANLLSTKWVDNNYYSPTDYEYLSIVTFGSTRLISDNGYIESIYNPKKCQVKRTYFNFFGEASGTQIARLQPSSFWRRVRYLRVYHEKYGVVPVSPIRLPLLRAVDRITTEQD